MHPLTLLVRTLNSALETACKGKKDTENRIRIKIYVKTVHDNDYTKQARRFNFTILANTKIGMRKRQKVKS